MIRLLYPLFLMFVIVTVLIRLVQHRGGAARDGLYRPKSSRARRTGPQTDPTASVRVDRATLSRLRDALTGANLDPDDELSRCNDCDSYYGLESLRALVQENGARCVNCGSLHRVPVLVTP